MLMPLNLCFDTRNQNKNTRSEFLNHPLETDSQRQQIFGGRKIESQRKKKSKSEN